MRGDSLREVNTVLVSAVGFLSCTGGAEREQAILISLKWSIEPAVN